MRKHVKHANRLLVSLWVTSPKMQSPAVGTRCDRFINLAYWVCVCVCVCVLLLIKFLLECPITLLLRLEIVSGDAVRSDIHNKWISFVPMRGRSISVALHCRRSFNISWKLPLCRQPFTWNECPVHRNQTKPNNKLHAHRHHTQKTFHCVMER